MNGSPSNSPPLVSVIIPCHNAEAWLQACLQAVACQTYRPLELSFWNDASTDASAKILTAACEGLRTAGVSVRVGETPCDEALGCGAAKNRAVMQSSGAFLCFQDADDVMQPNRVQMQLEMALAEGPLCLIGSDVTREPAGAQPRHTAWLCSLGREHLLLQRFKECTLAMPTWFCSRSLFDRVGGFSEAGQGTPEDLMFFYEHLQLGGKLAKVPEPLVLYRYHESQASHGVSADRIWDLRMKAIQIDILDGLPSFSIWSAGRDGKRFFRSLTASNREKVRAFLDIDAKKISAGHYFDREARRHVPVVEWTAAGLPEFQPSIICVKSGLHEGFEENLASLRLMEGVQYWHFN